MAKLKISNQNVKIKNQYRSGIETIELPFIFVFYSHTFLSNVTKNCAYHPQFNSTQGCFQSTVQVQLQGSKKDNLINVSTIFLLLYSAKSNWLLNQQERITTPLLFIIMNDNRQTLPGSLYQMASLKAEENILYVTFFCIYYTSLKISIKNYNICTLTTETCSE